MKAVFQRTSTGILPQCEESLALFDKIPEGSMVLVEFKKKRNYENLKRFFEFINITFDMQDFYENKEHYRKAIQMIAGHFDTLIIVGKDGETTTHYQAKSINFDEMDELEFRPLFSRCITGFLDRYSNGITEQELLTIISFD